MQHIVVNICDEKLEHTMTTTKNTFFKSLSRKNTLKNYACIICQSYMRIQNWFNYTSKQETCIKNVAKNMSPSISLKNIYNENLEVMYVSCLKVIYVTSIHFRII